MNHLVLWVAQGFGVGRIPFAPGTLGSVVGVTWFAALVATGRLWTFVAGCVMAVGASVWLCGRAEKIMHQTDPGSVVLDEIAAMPLCFVVWLVAVAWKQGTWPGLISFFAPPQVFGTLAVFVGFRLFDVWKPWPVRQSQSLPGGWGVTVDDLLAAGYVNLTSGIVLQILTWAQVRTPNPS